jgi:hypothetical protein
LRYLLLPLNVRFLPGRVRCEMTAVSRQSKPAILTAGKGVGGRANAICERGDLDQAGGRGIDGRRPKLGRLVSRELFVKPAKEKSLRLVLAARTAQPKA